MYDGARLLNIVLRENGCLKGFDNNTKDIYRIYHVSSLCFS